MLVLKILSTVFLGFSAFLALFRHWGYEENNKDSTDITIYIMDVAYSLGWRALVIVTIWVI